MMPNTVRMCAFVLGAAIMVAAMISLESPLAWLVFGAGICALALAATWRANR